MPFENLEIMLGRSIPLDVESLQDKLVARRRGGYCFEHGALFAALLERLGFRFPALVGRVTMGAPPASRLATHALLAVEFDDGTRKLCDVRVRPRPAGAAGVARRSCGRPGRVAAAARRRAARCRRRHPVRAGMDPAPALRGRR